MLQKFTKGGKGLPVVPSLVICAVALILYKIFRSPELDHRIEAVADAWTNKT